MRILHVSSSRTFGGPERHFVDLTRGLSERGHGIFAAVRPTCQWKNRLDVLPADNLFEVSIRNSFGILSALKIADFIRENKIEIVHAHVARDYVPASIACLAADAKFVLTRHVLHPLKPFNRFALKNLSRAIGISDAIADGLKKIFPAFKVKVIRNGIEIISTGDGQKEELGSEFRSLHSIPLDAPIVGTLGDLREQKGQREFVLAAAEIVKAVPNCRFVVVGRDVSIDKKFRRELKRLVHIFDLEDRFLWLDQLDDTRPFFAAIDLFVSPARTASYGTAIIEAMANKAAIVATETEAAKQLLGINGALVPIDYPAELAHRVSTLLEDAKVRENFTNEAFLRASSMFDLDRMIEQTEQLYEEILREN